MRITMHMEHIHMLAFPMARRVTKKINAGDVVCYEQRLGSVQRHDPQ